MKQKWKAASKSQIYNHLLLVAANPSYQSHPSKSASVAFQ